MTQALYAHMNNKKIKIKKKSLGAQTCKVSVLYLARSHVLFGFSLASKACVKVLSLALLSKAYVKVLGADFLSTPF
jgi:hypothetical protein